MVPVVNQRDVYLLPFPLNNRIPDHLFIVLSTLESNKIDGTFIAVMITTSDINYDDFSFDLTNEMFESDLDKAGSHVRMHLLTLWMNDEIVGKRVNRMKEFYFKQLMASIGDSIFNYKFEPL
jgi:hypothetical protein